MKTAKQVCEVEIAAYKENKRLVYEAARLEKIEGIIKYLISQNGSVTFNDCYFYPDREFKDFINDPFYKQEMERLGYKVELYLTKKRWYGTTWGSLTISACCGSDDNSK